MMREQLTMTDSHGKICPVYLWYGDNARPKGILQISHGMAEHLLRYEHLAQYLCDKGYAVIGASIQDEKSHKKFIEKYDLPFPIIADTEKKLVEELGVFGEKKMYGKVTMGTFRTTFITDEDGVITRIIGPKEIKVKDT